MGEILINDPELNTAKISNLFFQCVKDQKTHKQDQIKPKTPLITNIDTFLVQLSNSSSSGGAA